MLSRRPSAFIESLPKFIFDTSMDPKQRARLTEREMNEQAKIVQDLKALGASQTTIDTETRKLDELKGIIFHDFRREVLNRLKKQSDKASVIKDKLGIGSNISSHAVAVGGRAAGQGWNPGGHAATDRGSESDAAGNVGDSRRRKLGRYSPAPTDGRPDAVWASHARSARGRGD